MLFRILLGAAMIAGLAHAAYFWWSYRRALRVRTARSSTKYAYLTLAMTVFTVVATASEAVLTF